MSVRGGNGNESRAPARVTLHVGGAAVPIDSVSLDYAVSWIMDTHRHHWEVMVTPNLHHLRVVRSSPNMAERYTGSALSLADGWPVAWLASRVGGRRVERVVGENVFQALIERPGKGTRLLLVGGTPGAQLEDLIRRCRRRGWQVSNERAPRAELDNPALRAELVERIARAGSGGVVVIGVGMPRQEELATEIAALPGSGAVLCLGMSINFSSGVARATPKGVQTLGLESVYRIAQEPRRLFGRYVKDALVLPSIMRENPRPRAT